ncbi:transposase family protein [Acinetobacter sp.]|jgi:hypothetical protein|uniref:helix-turn-helix domain-containing protein n=1 Tax=Acinetobacter sp. TaxID=472 RepID=UPI002827AFBD|nr:transposase family protein [Acinetobacter sp.]MDR0235962.1 transposase family protein [Acinetobacter sp.]MDR2279105.1 transposase family protein [Vagococcus sp.]
MQFLSEGRPPKLCLEYQVLLCLSYWREYRTLFHVTPSYGVSEPIASRIIRQVENTLVPSGLFILPKDIPEGEGIDWNAIIIDRSEVPIQTLKKQMKSYSGKKKRIHKVQAIIHSKTQQILSLFMSRCGTCFELFKRNLHLILTNLFILADKGYQGIYALYSDSLLLSKAK